MSTQVSQNCERMSWHFYRPGACCPYCADAKRWHKRPNTHENGKLLTLRTHRTGRTGGSKKAVKRRAKQI